MTSKEIAEKTHAKFDALVKEKGVTPYAISKDLGIRQSAFSDWKAGRYTPKYERLQSIADYLGVPISYFYDD